MRECLCTARRKLFPVRKGEVKSANNENEQGHVIPTRECPNVGHLSNDGGLVQDQIGE
jgi:hypothetical protein